MDNKVTHNGREFELKKLDGILLLRVLHSLTGVLERSEDAIATIVPLLRASAEERAGMVQPIIKLISSIEEKDLLKLAAALFQFRNEAEGLKYFAEEGLDILPLIHAVRINIDLTSELVGALGGFFNQAVTGETTEPQA